MASSSETGIPVDPAKRDPACEKLPGQARSVVIYLDLPKIAWDLRDVNAKTVLHSTFIL